ncbi:MAG: hypothetical protein ACLU9V_05180 [Roseburia sp.]
MHRSRKESVFLSSGIRIKGSRFPLRDVAAKNILLQRQTSFCFTAETELVIPGLYRWSGSRFSLLL